MICVSDVQQLIQGWTERLGNPAQPAPYRDALSECVYDLNNLINRSIQEELSYQDYLEQQADEYFSNLEPEDYAAA